MQQQQPQPRKSTKILIGKKLQLTPTFPARFTQMIENYQNKHGVQQAFVFSHTALPTISKWSDTVRAYIDIFLTEKLCEIQKHRAPKYPTIEKYYSVTYQDESDQAAQNANAAIFCENVEYAIWYSLYYSTMKSNPTYRDFDFVATSPVAHLIQALLKAKYEEHPTNPQPIENFHKEFVLVLSDILQTPLQLSMRRGV